MIYQILIKQKYKEYNCSLCHFIYCHIKYKRALIIFSLNAGSLV